MTKEINDKDLLEITNTAEIFGISQEEVDEIIKELEHAQIDTDSMSELAKLIKITGSGKIGFRCYAWGRVVAKNEILGKQRLENLNLAEMMKKVEKLMGKWE